MYGPRKKESRFFNKGIVLLYLKPGVCNIYGSGYFAGPGKIVPRSYFAGPGKIAILDL